MELSEIEKNYQPYTNDVFDVDFLYCLYAQSLHHGRIEGRNQSRHFCRNHWSINITVVICTGR